LHPTVTLSCGSEQRKVQAILMKFDDEWRFYDSRPAP
jgi:hypothetical protein